MYKLAKITVLFSASLLMCQFVDPVFAQSSANDDIEAWRSLDEDFRQAIVEVISARRGLKANAQTPDRLIRSPKDIEEALRVSCEISGSTTCADVIGEGEELEPPPGYTVEQGFENGKALRRMRSGN